MKSLKPNISDWRTTTPTGRVRWQVVLAVHLRNDDEERGANLALAMSTDDALALVTLFEYNIDRAAEFIQAQAAASVSKAK